MTSRKSLALGALALLLVLGTPHLAAADDSNNSSGDSTLSALQSQLQGLLSEVSSLEAQIRAFGGGTGAASNSTIMFQHPGGPSVVGTCEMFLHTLQQGDSDGDTGGEVSSLQHLLAQDPTIFPSGLVTGFFGPMTAQAVANFQMKQGITTATTSGAGIVGPTTRGALFSWCGRLGGGNGQGNGNGMGPNNVVLGTISAVSGSTITLSTRGGSRTVNVTASTTIAVWSGPANANALTPASNAAGNPSSAMKLFTQGTIADLVVGKTIVVLGAPANGSASNTAINALHITVGVPIPGNGPMLSAAPNDHGDNGNGNDNGDDQ